MLEQASFTAIDCSVEKEEILRDGLHVIMVILPQASSPLTGAPGDACS